MEETRESIQLHVKHQLPQNFTLKKSAIPLCLKGKKPFYLPNGKEGII